MSASDLHRCDNPRAVGLLCGCLVMGLWSAALGKDDDAIRQEIAKLEKANATLEEHYKQELAAIEKDNADLKDDIRRAEARIEQLEKELKAFQADPTRALSQSDPGVVVLVAPAATEPMPRLVDYPARKVNALGMVQPSETKLVDPVEGATAVRLAPFHPSDAFGQVTMAESQPAKELSLSLDLPRQGNVKVAALALKKEGLFWAWHSFLSTGIGDLLERLDRLVQTSIIELRDDQGALVARFQLFPLSANLEIRVGRSGFPPHPQALPLGEQGMVLAGEDSAGEWEVEAVEAGCLRYTYKGWAFTVTLDIKGNTVAAQWEPNPKAALRQIATEIEKLKARRKAAYSTSTREVITKRLDNLENKREKLAATIAADWAPRPADIIGCRARIVLANEVILYKISFTR